MINVIVSEAWQSKFSYKNAFSRFIIKKMNAGKIKKEDVEFFFNKYKFNSDQIFYLERKLLKESYDYDKWESILSENSSLTRKLFIENEKLIDDYIRPAISNPEKLSPDAIKNFTLHTTFFLFENNTDSLVVEDLLNALLKVSEKVDLSTIFEIHMNLGISKTVTCCNSLDEVLNHFKTAEKILPTFKSCPNQNTKIHWLFNINYQMLAHCLYKSDDYAEVMDLIDRAIRFIHSGDNYLYNSMWGEGCDAEYHIALLYRIFKVYAIFVAYVNGFDSKDKSEKNLSALKTICDWVETEYSLEESDGNINPMIYTSYYKLLKMQGKLSSEQYYEKLQAKYQELFDQINSEKDPLQFIYPESAFPDDGDPLPGQFALLLDKIKLFNWSFTYVNILLKELYTLEKDVKARKKITEQILSYFENAEYAAKGFQIDNFIIDIVKTLATSFENVNEFMSFVQTIFVHREITSSIHFAMVANLCVICLSHMIDRKPELFCTGKYKTAKDVIENRKELLEFIKNAAMLHDVGKIGLTNLINLHFRKITNAEYGIIQTHSDLGAKIVDGVEYLAPYKDLILGHHKYFDGIQGYPKGFNQRESEYAVFIDLLSICDCLDTATDYKGRNYAAKKTFDEILTEFKDEHNNRYSKALVKIIDEDEALKEELRYMTGDGRKYTSYETYHQFIKPNTTFCEKDERSVEEYSDLLEARVLDFYRDCYPKMDVDKIRTHIEEQIDGKSAKMYVLCDRREKVYGVLAGRYYTPLDNHDPYFFITEVLVTPERRRQGLGTALVNEVSKLISEKGVHNLRVNIVKDLNTESFFWIMGFTQTKAFRMEKKI